MQQPKHRPWDGEPPGAYRFGGFALETGRGALLRPDGTETALRPKTAEVLRRLAERAGQVVTREELMRTVWPGVFVTDDNITQCVAEIRQALGETGAGLLRTLPKRGYLLAAEAPPKTTDASTDAPRGPAAARPSLAVLPFANLDGGPEQDRLADGITEEVTTALSRARWFSVVGRNAALAHKGRAADPRRVGRELGVRYVLTGSVRRDGARVRVACHLVEAESGRQVWADRFEGDPADVFAVQDRVAEAVTLAVEPSLERAEFERARSSKPPREPSAHDLVLRAWPHYRAVTREGSDAALALLRQAMALDPEAAYLKAFAAECLSRRAAQHWIGPGEREEGVRLAREALAAAPDNPLVLICAANALGVLALDAKGAHAAASRALALHPNSAWVRGVAGWTCNWVGDAEAAAEHFRHAIRLGPLDPNAAYPLAGLAIARIMAGQPQEALAPAEAAVRQTPGVLVGHLALIATLSLLGRREEAAAAAARFREVAPAAACRVPPPPPQGRCGLYLDRRFAEAFMRALREAGLPG